MFLQSLQAPFIIIRCIFIKTAIAFLTLSIVATIFHRFGIINRLVLLWIESEISHVANHAQISVSRVEIRFLDWLTLQSTIRVYDSILHTPQGDKWQWESPVVARIGYLEVIFNPWSLIDMPIWFKTWLGIRVQSIKDLYSVDIKDVQVFVEKRRNVLNFHLLDERLDLPLAKDVLNSIKYNVNGNGASPITANKDVENSEEVAVSQEGVGYAEHSNPIQSHRSAAPLGMSAGGCQTDESDFDGSGDSSLDHESDVPISENGEFPSRSSTSAILTTTSSSSISMKDKVKDKTCHQQDEASNDDDEEKAKKAKELVMQIVGAVSTLGRAVNEGGTQGLSDELRIQKDGFVSHLRNVQAMVGLSINDDQKANTTSTTTSIDIAKEGIQVIKHVGKVVEENVLNMKEQVDDFSKPPPFRKDWTPLVDPPMFRIGLISIQDLRIFTKDIILAGQMQMQCSAYTQSFNQSGNGRDSHNFERINGTGWSKPILVKDIRIFPSDLCPPCSDYSKNKDCEAKEDSLNLIAQPIENIGNMLLERVLTEMAKSTTGQLLNNAFADVFTLFNNAITDNKSSDVCKL